MPASIRITSSVRRWAQAALGALLPHPNLDRSLTQSLGKVSDFFLQLLLPRGRLGLPSLSPEFAGLEELPLPVPDRLLGHFLPPGCVRNGDLALQHRQDDPQLLLQRDSWWTTHDNQTFHSRVITTPAT